MLWCDAGGAILNTNFLALVGLALLYGLSAYWRSRRAGVTAARAIAYTLKMTTALVVLGILYALALNALHVPWYSIAGYGVGLVFGLAGLAVILAFQKWQGRQGNWG